MTSTSFESDLPETQSDSSGLRGRKLLRLRRRVTTYLFQENLFDYNGENLSRAPQKFNRLSIQQLSKNTGLEKEDTLLGWLKFSIKY